jgi:hypothetical protein
MSIPGESADPNHALPIEPFADRCGGCRGRRGVEGKGVGPGEPDALVELADGELSGVPGQLAPGRPDHERHAEEIKDF